MLSLMVFAPFLAALLMFAASGKDSRSASRLAVILSSMLFLSSLSLLVAGTFATSPIGWFQIPGIDVTVTFAFATNGFAAWMVFLANIITLAALIAFRKTDGDYRNFAIGMFAQLGALNGTFLAADAVLFFFFFEALVFPAAMLIGAYGGSGRRSAALHFALYTLIGSAPMAVALWYLACAAGSSDFDSVAQMAQALPESTQTVLFWCFVLAFWVKTPLFPLHGWQAETYAEAPAGLSAVLTGSMSKAGVYGFFFWVLPVFPSIASDNAKLLMGIGLFTAVYGALMAMRAKDIKKLLAFSSMGHLGLAVAGIFALSADTLPAVLVLLVGHGLSASALFILSGSAERFAGSRLLDKMGGYARRYPVFAFFFGTASVLAIAIPGTAGFVGEFLVLCGLWSVSKVAAIVTAVVIILSAVYMLRLIQQVLFGEGSEPSEDAKAFRFPIAEAVAVAPLLLLLLVFGIHPAPIMRTLDVSIDEAQRAAELEAAIAAASRMELAEDPEAALDSILDSIEEQEKIMLDSADLDVKQVEAQDVR